MAWTRHKCERIAAFGLHYATIIREQLPECVVGAYMCPWTPVEFDGALTRIFAQDYALLAPAIDIFTPLIYGVKSGRPVHWGRMFLDGVAAYLPPERRAQLILDALDGPQSLRETAVATHPSWGLQVFGGAQVFADPAFARVFQESVERIRTAIIIRAEAAAS